MRTIHKFDVAYGGQVKHMLPADARVVHVAMDGVPCLWVELHLDRPRIYRTFRTYCTGDPIDADAKYVGTFLADGFVGHVYELREEAVVERD